eukprot:6067418-Amphidinium_carterae.1
MKARLPVVSPQILREQKAHSQQSMTLEYERCVSRGPCIWLACGRHGCEPEHIAAITTSL